MYGGDTMPRFENEGFNSNKRKNVDRTVPQNENYYGRNPVDLNFNNRDNIVRDNQVKRGINPCDNTETQFTYREPAERQFQSETAQDYINNQRRVAVPPPQRNNGGKRNNDRKKDKPKSKLKKPKVTKIILSIILALILIIIASLLIIMNRVNYNDKVENTYVSESELVSSGSVKNILLLGVDARVGQNAEETRSDTMMLVSFDTKHHTIKLTSFLRDTWLYVPTLGYNQRLNAACSSGGYQGVVDAIEYNYKIDIDGYAVVNFEMFKVLVDSLGGVEVDVSEAEAKEVTNHPGVYGDVVLESGKYKLTGEQALAYCRIRKIDTDFVRTERQRTVMSSILSSAKHSDMFKLLNMAFKSAPYIETDLTKTEIMGLATTAAICITGDIQQEKVPFEGTWEYASIQGNSVISIDLDANRQQIEDYIYNN